MLRFFPCPISYLFLVHEEIINQCYCLCRARNISRWEASRCFFYFLVAYELPVCLVHTRSSIHFSVPSFSLCHFECSDRLIVSILDRILVEISCRDTSYLRRNLLGQSTKVSDQIFTLLNYFSPLLIFLHYRRRKIFEKNGRANAGIMVKLEKNFIHTTNTEGRNYGKRPIYTRVFICFAIKSIFYSNNSLFHTEIQFYFHVNHFTS